MDFSWVDSKTSQSGRDFKRASPECKVTNLLRKIPWSFTSTSPYVFMVWSLSRHKEIMFPYLFSTHPFIIRMCLSGMCRTGWNSRFLENVHYLKFCTTEGTLREQSEVHVSFQPADGTPSQVFNFTVEFHSCRSSWHVFSVRRSLMWVHGSMFRARVSWLLRV